MFVENETAMKRNEVVQNNLPGELYTTEVSDQILDDCKYQLALIQAARNQKQQTRLTKTFSKVAQICRNLGDIP